MDQIDMRGAANLSPKAIPSLDSQAIAGGPNPYYKNEMTMAPVIVPERVRCKSFQIYAPGGGRVVLSEQRDPRMMRLTVSQPKIDGTLGAAGGFITASIDIDARGFSSLRELFEDEHLQPPTSPSVELESEARERRRQEESARDRMITELIAQRDKEIAYLRDRIARMSDVTETVSAEEGSGPQPPTPLKTLGGAAVRRGYDLNERGE